LKKTNYAKYFENLLNCINIVENKTHEFVFSIQLIKDNQIALTLIKDAYIYDRLKHIDVIYYYVRDFYKSNRIRISFVRSANIIVDELTKLLFRNKFKIFIKQLELINQKINKN